MENNPIIVSLPEELQSGSPSVDTIKIFEDNGFGRDLSRRVLYLTGEINGGFNSDGEPCCRTIDIVNDIQRYNIKDRDLQIEDRKPIWIMIDSPGGDMSGMWTLVNAIRISKTPVYTVNTHDALSAAGIILMAGHKRFAYPGTNVLVHSGSVMYGGMRECAESMKQYFDRIDKSVQDYIFSHTKISQKSYKAKAPKDWWMNEEEALNNGIIDRIIESFDEVGY